MLPIVTKWEPELLSDLLSRKGNNTITELPSSGLFTEISDTLFTKNLQNEIK